MGLRIFFLQFFVDILPIGSGSVDPHIFADPDPGGQNLANPTDPDPKHCLEFRNLYLMNDVTKDCSILDNPVESTYIAAFVILFSKSLASSLARSRSFCSL